ncbi:MFS transporter [Kitasatospora sp. NBC_01302]|uniref:MFS transporter n=1 Tax=Kitasatospora sp. NBC_01302 TaxID=2903575 RepID=UPI002E0DAE23|nr:MFS transporter [Kitasatospora sp. NBC_01302]
MTLEEAVRPARSRRERLGLPQVRGAGPLLTASLVDSAGSGLFLPYALLYFLDTTRLPLTTIGVALSAAAALALPCAALFGPLVDRIGARAAVVLANAVQAAGFLGYLAAGAAWQITAFGFLANAGQSLFWTANGALVTLVGAPGDRARWFGLLRVVRNAGTGTGALLAVVLASGAGPTGGRLVVAADAGSFLLAAGVLARWRPPATAAALAPAPAAAPAPAVPPAPAAPCGYRRVLADRSFAALNAVTLLLVLNLLAVPLVLTLYTTRLLGRPAWVAGLLIAGNTALVAALQTPLAELLRRRHGPRRLRLAAAMFAASAVLLWSADAAGTGWVAVGLVAGLLAFTLGEIICSPVLPDLVAALAPPGLSGRYFALHQTCWSLAAVLAPSLFTRLLNRGSAWLWTALLAVACLAYLLATGIERPRGGQRPAARTGAAGAPRGPTMV